MIKLERFHHLNGKNVSVICTDGEVVNGYWSEIFSAEDNAELAADNGREAPGASILVDVADGAPLEVYTSEIECIEEV